MIALYPLFTDRFILQYPALHCTMAISWRLLSDFFYGHLSVSCKSTDSAQAFFSLTVKRLDDSDRKVEFDLELCDSIACLRKVGKGSRGNVKGYLKSHYEFWECVRYLTICDRQWSVRVIGYLFVIIQLPVFSKILDLLISTPSLWKWS